MGQCGVVPTEQALQMAQEKGLDLVEVAPNVRPPVCKIMDFGKYKYEQNKKAHDSTKKQHKTKLKTVRLRPKTDPLGEETRAYGTRLLFRLALAVALGAGVSLAAGLWAAADAGLWRLGTFGLLLAAGVAGVLGDRVGQAEAGRGSCCSG